MIFSLFYRILGNWFTLQQFRRFRKQFWYHTFKQSINTFISYMTFCKCNKNSSFIFKCFLFWNIGYADWFKINAEKEKIYFVRNNFRFIWIQCFHFHTFVYKLLTLNLFSIVNIKYKSKESNNKWPQFRYICIWYLEWHFKYNYSSLKYNTDHENEFHNINILFH